MSHRRGSSISETLHEYVANFDRENLTRPQKSLIQHLSDDYGATHTLLFGENRSGPFPELAFVLPESDVHILVSPSYVRIDFRFRAGIWPFRKEKEVVKFMSFDDFEGGDEFVERIRDLVNEASIRAQAISPHDRIQSEMEKNEPEPVKIAWNLDGEILDRIQHDYKLEHSGQPVRVMLVPSYNPSGLIGWCGEFIAREEVGLHGKGIVFEHDSVLFYAAYDDKDEVIEDLERARVSYPREGFVFVDCRGA